MSSKAYASKKRSQQLKRNPKRKIDDKEVELSEKEAKNTVGKNKNHPKHLSSEGQTEQTSLRQVKIASSRRKTWQPLSESSRKHLQTMMETVIIAILSDKVRENEQIQYHLNFLKKRGTIWEYIVYPKLLRYASLRIRELIRKNLKVTNASSYKFKQLGFEQYFVNFNSLQLHFEQFEVNRLLQIFETLKVPAPKLKDLTNMSSLLKMERARHRANEEGLASLQEEIDKIVETIEAVTGNIQSLKNKIQILTSEVEKEEEKVKQMFQIDSTGVLSLPELPQKTLKAPILQEEILAQIPNQKALLKDFDVLHNSSQTKNMLTFIEEAYKRLDAS